MAIKNTYKNKKLYEYDISKNPDCLNVYQLSADGIAWLYQGKEFARSFKNKGIACGCDEHEIIAVVEINPLNKENKSYFIDFENKFLKYADLPTEIEKFVLAPYDVYLFDGLFEILYEDMEKFTYDYRVDYSPVDQKIVNWSPTK